ncbi:hypothetical protein FRC07_005632 [Ceratobasidium sp. 392]|nr:hypothetical protein FRC07_005632 [Ceratobasidium sp. 392]
MHSLVHLFDDIWAKGVTANFSTKPGESMHGPLHQAYLTSSKKSHSVGAEIARKTHLRAVYEFIQAQIEYFDKQRAKEALDKPKIDEFDVEVAHVSLGTKAKSFQSLETFDKQSNYLNTSGTLQQAVVECLDDLGYKILPSTSIKIRDCKHIKIHPRFHLKERQDCVLVNSNEGVSFARLVLLGECKDVASPPSFPDFPFVLVSFFDLYMGAISAIERALGFRRLRERPIEEARVIPARSIIRGALLVSILDPKHPNDYLANDIFDPDMFFRLRMYTKQNKI